MGTWTILYDDLPNRPINGAIKITWVDFDDPGDDKRFLKEHRANYFYLSIDPDEPQIFLNRSFDGLEPLLADRRRRGLDKALHDQTRASIADKTWSALFNAAFDAVEVDVDTGEPEWPSVDWQRNVLESLLSRMFPQQSGKQALDEACTARHASDNPGDPSGTASTGRGDASPCSSPPARRDSVDCARVRLRSGGPMSILTILDHNATRLLTPGFRGGLEAPDFGEYEQDIQLGHPVDLDAVRSVIDEVMSRFSRRQVTEADVWLAPRLHHALRLTRREAANRGIWRWLAVVFAADYVRWRWGSPGGSPGHPDVAAQLERFDGADYKHALARLWWMAELFRNGPDYGPVAIALGNQDIPNYLFRLDVAHHRPTVQAAVRVLDGRSGREANALAKAVNAAASTLALDVIGLDVPLDAEASLAWIKGEDVDPGRYFDRMPPGPEDPPVAAEAVDAMVMLLEEFFAEAPVRGHETAPS